MTDITRIKTARCCSRPDSAARRTLLRFAGLAALSFAGGLSGCDSGGGQARGPAEIGPGSACHLDGMLLAEYPGPKGQILVTGLAEPMFFCDTMELFNIVLAGEQVLRIEAIYVQDMGQAGWEEPRGHWFDARKGWYVIGSKRHGSMGPTIASFAQETDAQRHAADYGGKVLKYGQITREMVDLSGGALHDKRM